MENIEEKQIVANQLLEIITPDGRILEAILPHFSTELEEAALNDASLMWALCAAGQETSIVSAEKDDFYTFFQLLTKLAGYWDVDLFLGDFDDLDGQMPREMDMDYETLLHAVADALREHDLQLWQWDCGDEQVGVCFIARAADQDLVSRCGQRLEEHFALVEDDIF